MVRPIDQVRTTARRAFGAADRLLYARLPAPPSRLRVGPFRRGAFTSRLRNPVLTSRLGLVLGIAITTCFATGLLSHYLQHPPRWFWWPAHPVWLYRVTQGLHVATGLGSIGLLTAKLWSVYPRLFAWPPFRNAAHAMERVGVLVLAAAALFQVVTGLLNITYWYGPMPFAFLAGHYWVAWLLMGALLLHVAVKLPIIKGALARRQAPQRQPQRAPQREPQRAVAGPLTRRGFFGAVAATVGVVTLATVGQTVRPLRTLSVLAPRRPDIGPQGFPVNTSASAAGVLDRARDPAYRLVVIGPGGRRELSLAQLRAMPQTTVELPITCVEGWSAGATWTGIRVRELIGLVGAAPHSTVIVRSLQTAGANAASVLDPDHTGDADTLIALRVRERSCTPITATRRG